MDITNDTAWEWIVKIFEWLGSALLAVAIFIFKGYRDEFNAIKASNEKLENTLIKLENSLLLMAQTVTHTDNNIKNWDNGSRQMLHDIMKAEKNIELLQMEIKHLKESK
jgi:hypothetical protein